MQYLLQRDKQLIIKAAFCHINNQIDAKPTKNSDSTKQLAQR